MVEITFIPIYSDSFKASLKNSSISQSFSIPSNIIYYIANNYLLLKLLKSCKYFYINGDMVICAKESEKAYGNSISFSQMDSKTLQLCCKYFMRQLFFEKKFPNAIQLFGKFSIHPNHHIPYMASSILERAYYSCDITYLSLSSQNLSYDEYLFLTSSRNITHFYFGQSTIKYKNGEIVSLDKLLEPLPNLVYLFTTIPKATEPNHNLSLKVAHAMNFKKLKACGFFNFAFHEFDIKELISFFKRSEHLPTFFIFFFSGVSVNLEIVNFVNELLASWTIEDGPLPAISFYGMEEEKSEAMRLKRIEFKNRRGISFDSSTMGNFFTKYFE